ncbi:SseB family protein [Campylobacter concisus]|uniref:Transporter n=1 Tax=Campylobacter concisus TaxID=199 RepID=A0A1Y5NLZ9_9BACT|nr:SseB family protein [Campylobacter concisus]OUT19095.1 transporter [Campylobacter concisus]
MQEVMDKFLKEPNQQNEVNLIAALKKASFFAPVLLNQALAKPDGGVVYEEEGSNIKFILLEDDGDKLSYFPAFTSKEAMRLWRNDSEQESIEIGLKEYLAMLKESSYAGVVVDAFSYDFILKKEQIARILD